MKRREFILASGSAILTGTSLSATQSPVASLEFELSTTPKKDPSSVDSILVDFSKFELTPRYLDSSDDLTVEITVSLDDMDSEQVQSDIQVKQDITKSDISSKLPLSIDGINTSQDSIDGEIEIVVSHPDLDNQIYRQSFEINGDRIGIIDAFEDSDLSEYSGDTGAFSFASSSPSPYEGSYCLRSSSDNKKIESYAGLSRYPQSGDTFQYRVQIADSSADGAGFRFGRQDGSNQYLIRYGRDGNGYRFDSMSGGSISILAQDDSTSLLENEWVQVKVDWKNNGDFTITFYDESGSQITQLNATDSTYKGGGIAFTTAGSTSGYVQQSWDIAEIISSDG